MRSKYLTIGILAHVDAGKTTLSESVLYSAGAIGSAGRVDHKDTFLDTFAVEKARGITVFSKPAIFSLNDMTVTLLDTPGHADFSPEMERVLEVLDYCILIISAPEGVGARVKTLWRLLKHYGVPAFIFVNKMDQPGTDRDALLSEIKRELTDAAVDMTDGVEKEEVQEELATLDEALLDKVLAGGLASDGEIADLISARRLFPLYFGSALKQTGTEALIDGMGRFMRPGDYPEEFGARIYKITREDGKERLSWIKLTGGSLKIRDRVFENADKISGIRLYSGAKYESVTEAEAGQICAVQGIGETRAGQGLGFEADSEEKLLLPVIRRRVILPEGADPALSYMELKKIEEEEPMLRLSYTEETKEIFAQIMGEVQTQILRGIIKDRLGLEVDFGDGQIIYRETVKRSVEGVGHFEPLRHYAEVHVVVAPGEPGSGVAVDADCRTDLLKENWQRLAVSNLTSKRHIGVLTGSELTDVRITLIGGRAHEKHTEGGDFRKAAIRAVRQALMGAENILLEPVYEFRIELPRNYLGMVMTDIEAMSGRLDAPEIDGETAVVTGKAPVATFGDYALKVRAACGGEGSVAVSPGGYMPCHNAAEVITARGYEADADIKNPASSVFCSHGAGVIVPWNEVRDRMHVDTEWRPDPDERLIYPNEEGFSPAISVLSEEEAAAKKAPAEVEKREKRVQSAEEELIAIFERTYGRIRRAGEEDADTPRKRVYEAPKPKYRAARPAPEKSYLLIDGYNMLYANPALKILAERDINGAREALIDLLSNIQGFTPEIMILVFDAYRVHGGKERLYKHHDLTVIYTKEAETADQYIEKAAHEMGRKYRVRVATSDGIEQVIVFGAGATRLSADGFWKEMELMSGRIRDIIGE